MTNAASMPGSTADELRARSVRHSQEAQESYERCDTDGALSQWASDRMSGLDSLAADIAENGGRAMFPALFTTDGDLVAAKLIDTRFGQSWALLPDDSGRGRFTGFFNPSKSQNGYKARATDAKKGFYVGYVMAPARAVMRGDNICTVTAVAERTDGGFSRDVEILDNGQHGDALDWERGRWYWATHYCYQGGESLTAQG